jgi:hypothetical protein
MLITVYFEPQHGVEVIVPPGMTVASDDEMRT